jgi:hypothetical protein
MAAQQWQMKYVSPYKPRILTVSTQRLLVRSGKTLSPLGPVVLSNVRDRRSKNRAPKALHVRFVVTSGTSRGANPTGGR